PRWLLTLAPDLVPVVLCMLPLITPLLPPSRGMMLTVMVCWLVHVSSVRLFAQTKPWLFTTRLIPATAGSRMTFPWITSPRVVWHRMALKYAVPVASLPCPTMTFDMTAPVAYSRAVPPNVAPVNWIPDDLDPSETPETMLLWATTQSRGA